MAGTKRTSRILSLYDDDDEDDRLTEAPPTKKLNENTSTDSKKSCSSSSDSPVVSNQNEKSASDVPEVVENFNLTGIEVSGSGMRQGQRIDMQDSQIELKVFDLNKPFIKRSALFAIFDGHSGSRASKYCGEVLPDLLRKQLAPYNDMSSLEKALKRTFIEVYKMIDDNFLADARKEKPVWKDGSTASTVLILNNSVYVANVGDSRVIVCREKPEIKDFAAIQLTSDHSPSVYEERVRIQKCGGHVKDGRVNGIIEVSRSIGDGHFKSLGVICTPDMKKLTLTDNDRFLVAACDGLWKVFSNEEAIKYVNENLDSKEEEEHVLDDSQRSSDPENAKWNILASKFAAEAVRRKCGDNVSVVLVKLSKLAE